MAAAESSSSPPVVLSRSTLVPVGLVFSVILAVVSLGMWLEARFSALEYSIQATKTEVQRLQLQVERAQHTGWSQDQQAAWAAILEARNPSLVVPKVR